jgi:hypothetical protein
MLICSVASVELRSLDRDDDQVRFLDGVADDQVLGTLEIDDDEPALRAGLVDPVDQVSASASTTARLLGTPGRVAQRRTALFGSASMMVTLSP